jgi:hypothetical protein
MCRKRLVWNKQRAEEGVRPLWLSQTITSTQVGISRVEFPFPCNSAVSRFLEITKELARFATPTTPSLRCKTKAWSIGPFELQTRRYKGFIPASPPSLNLVSPRDCFSEGEGLESRSRHTGHATFGLDEPGCGGLWVAGTDNATSSFDGQLALWNDQFCQMH